MVLSVRKPHAFAEDRLNWFGVRFSLSVMLMGSQVEVDDG